MSRFLREYLPYCLRPLGENKWVVLNRKYAHIGTNERSNLERFAKQLKITRKNQEKLSITGNFEGDICLYDDKTNPLLSKTNMDDYMVKIKLLAKMEIL